jgi:hypothetical protein
MRSTHFDDITDRVFLVILEVMFSCKTHVSLHGGSRVDKRLAWPTSIIVLVVLCPIPIS